MSNAISECAARAVGAVVVSPALQRGVSATTLIEPESRWDGAYFSPRRGASKIAQGKRSAALGKMPQLAPRPGGALRTLHSASFSLGGLQ